MKWVIPAILLQTVQRGDTIYELLGDHEAVTASKAHYDWGGTAFWSSLMSRIISSPHSPLMKIDTIAEWQKGKCNSK